MSWKHPYAKIEKEERYEREWKEGAMDGAYCKAWNTLCPKYDNQRTPSYNAGFKAATGKTPEQWDSPYS